MPSIHLRPDASKGATGGESDLPYCSLVGGISVLAHPRASTGFWRACSQNVRSRKSRETPSGITGFLRTDGLMTSLAAHSAQRLQLRDRTSGLNCNGCVAPFERLGASVRSPGLVDAAATKQASLTALAQVSLCRADRRAAPRSARSRTGRAGSLCRPVRARPLSRMTGHQG
jgi:hypothetical protein